MSLDQLFHGRRRKKETRICACGCGMDFTTTFPEKRYFNTAHRVKHWRNVTDRAVTKPKYDPAEWLRIRQAVLDRDKYTCVICGKNPTAIVHHILARKKGGQDTLGNLATVCTSCHRRIHAPS